MQSNRRAWIARSILSVIAVATFNLAPPAADAKKLWKNSWVVTITAPDSITGNHFGTQTYTIVARKFDEPPSPLPMRKLTATTQSATGQPISVQGVWRQTGKKFSLTFEMPCEPGVTCGTVILRGKFNSKTTMTGKAYVAWDTRDNENIARYETVNGSFEGVKE